MEGHFVGGREGAERDTESARNITAEPIGDPTDLGAQPQYRRAGRGHQRAQPQVKASAHLR
jgi:hypothetical protein